MENSNYKNKDIVKKSRTWYKRLTNYILAPIKKTAGGFKDKVANIFLINTLKQTMCGMRNKLSKPKTQKQSEENIIKGIRKNKEKNKLTT